MRQKIKNYFISIDTIFNRLIFSFVVVVILVISVIGFVLAAQFSTNYNSKLEEIEDYRLTYLINKINDLFSNADETTREIASLGNGSVEMQNFMYYAMKDNFSCAIDILKYMQILKSKNDSSISSIELTVPQNNAWISTFTGINYMEELNLKWTPDMNMFKPQSELNNNKYWIFKRAIKYSMTEIPVYSVISGYPLFVKDEENYKGYIVVNIKQDALDQLLQSHLSGDYDAIAIVDDQGNIISVQGNVKELEISLKKEQERNSSFLSNLSNDSVTISKNNIIINKSLRISNWRIINMISTRDYYSETRKIQQKVVLISLIVLFCGLLLSYLFAKRLYHPLYLIMDKLTHAKLNKKARENEYYYIDRAVDELYNRALQKEKALNDNRNIIQRNFVVNLLTVQTVDNHTINEKLAFLGIEEYPVKFILMIKLHKKVFESLDEISQNLVTYNIIHFFDCYVNNTIHCLSADINNAEICVLVFSKNADESNLRVLQNKLIDYMSMDFQMNPIILRSESFQNLKNAYDEYAVLKKIAEYIYFLPGNYYLDAALLKKNLKNLQPSMNCNFQSFSEALITRNLDQIDAILRKFIEDCSAINVSVDYLNGAVLKYVFIYNYFMRDIMKENNLNDDTKIFRDLNNQFDIQDFYYWFMQLIRNTFEELTGLEKSASKTAVSLIERVILDNLNQDLSLEFIAEKVYLSPKYISRLFKEERKLNITQFITECKLKKAAKLLIETNLSLEELIQEIGFSSTNYFIKKFKEKYSVTPSQYRRNYVLS